MRDRYISVGCMTCGNRYAVDTAASSHPGCPFCAQRQSEKAPGEVTLVDELPPAPSAADPMDDIRGQLEDAFDRIQKLEEMVWPVR